MRYDIKVWKKKRGVKQSLVKALVNANSEKREAHRIMRRRMRWVIGVSSPYHALGEVRRGDDGTLVHQEEARWDAASGQVRFRVKEL